MRALRPKGVRNLPMLMKASHIRENILTESEMKSRGFAVDKHTHYHGLGKELSLTLSGISMMLRLHTVEQKCQKNPKDGKIIF